MYLLNLLLDLTGGKTDKENGIFTSNASAAVPLENSRQWLRLTPDATHPDNPAPPFNAETAVWQPVGGSNDSHILLSKSEPPGHICVRIAPVAGTPVNPAATLSIFVMFGKPATAHQRHASPFSFDDLPTGRTVAAFHLHPAIAANSGTGWFFPMKPLAKAPTITQPNVVHRYEFIVGARLTNGGDIYTFGEDPQMDVSL